MIKSALLADGRTVLLSIICIELPIWLRLPTTNEVVVIVIIIIIIMIIIIIIIFYYCAIGNTNPEDLKIKAESVEMADSLFDRSSEWKKSFNKMALRRCDRKTLTQFYIDFLLNQWCICLEAKASPQGSKRSASASPRLDVLMPCLGLNVMISKLRYDIIIHNFHQFIFCTYVFKTFKTKLHLCIKQRF